MAVSDHTRPAYDSLMTLVSLSECFHAYLELIPEPNSDEDEESPVLQMVRRYESLLYKANEDFQEQFASMHSGLCLEYEIRPLKEIEV